MSQRAPTAAVGSPMADSLATMRVVVTDTRVALIPHTGRWLSLRCLTHSYPLNATGFTGKERHLFGVVVGQAGRSVAMRVGLLDELVRLMLEGGNGIGAGGEPRRRVVQGSELHEHRSKLGGIAPLLPIHALPRLDGRARAVGIV